MMNQFSFQYWSLNSTGCPKKDRLQENSINFDHMANQRCVRRYMGVHTSEDKLGRRARDLVMAQMCSASQNTFILSAKTPMRENYATFLKLIFFWDTLQIDCICYEDTKFEGVETQLLDSFLSLFTTLCIKSAGWFYFV